MSAESSWTLLKVIWQSCTDRFPNEIDPSIHTTPTFVEQPFRISFSLPLPSSPDPIPSTFDSMLDSTLPRLSFRSNNSPSFPVSLEGGTSSRRPVCSCLAGTRRHPLPTIPQLSTKRSFWSRVRSRFRKFRGGSTFRNFSGRFYRGLRTIPWGQVSWGTLGNFLIFFVICKHICVKTARYDPLAQPLTIFNQVKSVSLVSPFVYFILRSFFLFIVRGRFLILIRS